MRFKFIDITTADIAFEAYGKNLNELFSNAALAMFEVIVDTKLIKPKIKKTVEIKAQDLKSLLFDWLNEILFYFGSENLAFSKFDVKVDEKNFKLKAVCFGEKIDLKKHEIRTEVKATTYHKMKIEKTKEGWKTQVILDI